MGAHLDDMEIVLQDKQARRFASRGTQKAIAVLLKIAQARILPGRATLLLDDILADFDEQRLEKVMKVLMETGLQIVFTAPIASKESSNTFPFPQAATWIKLTF